MARFSVSPIAFINLIECFEKRIRELASSSSIWTPRLTASVQSHRPTIPVDREILSQYILIGNIDPKDFSSPESLARLPDMFRRVASSDFPGCEVDEEDLVRSFTGSVSHIRPSSIGLDDSLCVRSTKVIKLKSPMRVGVTLGGGTCLIHRTQANASTEEHGIFFTRQFLSDSEAKLLLHAETSNLDITLVMARRLTKKTELDDLIRRSFKHALESILNCEVHVWVWTMRHRWNGENNTEESFRCQGWRSLHGEEAWLHCLIEIV